MAASVDEVECTTTSDNITCGRMQYQTIRNEDDIERHLAATNEELVASGALKIGLLERGLYAWFRTVGHHEGAEV